MEEQRTSETSHQGLVVDGRYFATESDGQQDAVHLWCPDSCWLLVAVGGHFLEADCSSL